MSELLDQTRSCTGNNVGHSNDGMVVEGSPGAGSRATIKPLPKCEVAAVATRNHCVACSVSAAAAAAAASGGPLVHLMRAAVLSSGEHA